MADLLKDLLKREEGWRPYGYYDSRGLLTIGYGILIDRRAGGGLTEEEASWLLDRRIAAKTAEVEKALPWVTGLDEVRRAVLLSMAYQMGTEGLLKFRRTLRAVQEGRYADAAAAMLQSLWAAQTPERARRAADAMKTGTAASLLP